MLCLSFSTRSNLICNSVMQFSAPCLPCKFIFLSFITHMKHIYTFLSLCLLPAWTSTIPSRKRIEVRENLSDWQQAHMVKCQHFGMSFNGQTLQCIAIQQTYETHYQGIYASSFPANCLMPDAKYLWVYTFLCCHCIQPPGCCMKGSLDVNE